jgi:glycosyltransferase involved in cell wall biosynthesis
MNGQSERRGTILMVTGGFYPKVGGAERQAEQLARGLRRLGFEILVLTLRYRGDLPLEEERGGIRVVRIRYPQIKVLGRLFILLRLAAWLISHRRQYDLVHVQMAEYMAFVSTLVARPLGKPVVVRFARNPSAVTGVFGDFPEFVTRWRFLESVLLFGIRRADRIVAISGMIVEMAAGRGLPLDKIVRIPNGVDVETFRPVSATERERIRRVLDVRSGPAVVFMGRLIPRKGVADLLRAWVEITAKRSDATLYILGTGKSQEGLQVQARELGIGDSVQFRGSVENVVDYLRAADAFVLPSHFEGMPNALLEAMACGLPVVVTSVSGVVDIIRKDVNGILVEPKRPDRLAESLIRILDDSKSAFRLGSAARKTVQDRFSIDRVASMYGSLYGELLKGRNLQIPDAG